MSAATLRTPGLVTPSPEWESPVTGANADDYLEATPLFEEYTPADLTGARHGPELRYETEMVLGELIWRIVKVEGPVHQERIISQLRTLYGMGRAGEPTREHVLDVIKRLTKNGVLSLDHNFVYLPTNVIQPRRPDRSFRRLIDQISMRELAEGMSLVSSVIQGASGDELIIETARQFGFERTGPEIQAALRVVQDALIADDVLQMDTEGLVRPVRQAALLGPASNIEEEEEGSFSNLTKARALALQKGYELIDRTDSSGALWIVGGRELDADLRPLGFSFAPAGGRATRNRPAWYGK
jgi:hypothetical protein